MRSAFLWWLAAVWTISISLSQTVAQQASVSLLEQAREVRRPSPGGPPDYLCFSSTEAPKPETWKGALKKALHWPQSSNFRLISQHVDPGGELHARFQPEIHQIPIAGMHWVLHQQGRTIRSMNGDLPETLPEIPPTTLTEEEARNAAIGASPALCYAWDEAPKQFPWPRGTQWWLPQGNSLRLTWRFDIYAFTPLQREWVFIDAVNGKVLARWNRLHSADVPGQAHTLYDGIQSITTDSIGPGRYRLRASNRGRGIQTLDMRQGTRFSQAFDIENASRVWDDPQDRPKAGWSAHFAAEQVYDYFLQKYNRSSYDGAGAPLISYVHYNQNLANAFWNGQAMIFGDGDGVSSRPFVSPDLVAHEFVHGVTDKTAGLLYSGESGALNEMFSDIFGIMAEAWIRQGPVDWVLGAELNTRGGIRSLEDPQRFNHPDTYQGVFWFRGQADNGGVHINCGVGNHWFYLLTEGGSGTNDFGTHYQVQGIGLDSAAAIAYRALTVYLTPTSDYADARRYTIMAAEDLFGVCSAKARAVAAAWEAVGLGGGYPGSVRANFSTRPGMICDTPAVVQFDNQSQNALNYQWDFGDGTTATQSRPGHTYALPGTYQVQLIATGTGACNTADTLVQTVNVMASAGTTGPSCSPASLGSDPRRGIFQVRLEQIAHASVGSPEGYQDMSCEFQAQLTEGEAFSLQVTTGIDSVEAVTIWIDWNDDGDFLDAREEVLRSTALQLHADTLVVPAVQAINTPLRMRVRSEAQGIIGGPCEQARIGQVEDYSVVVRPRSVSPQAAFRADRRQAGVGEPVLLTDRSLGAPTAWQWNLNGAVPNVGNLDTLRVQYITAGKYPVQLRVANAQGADSIRQTDYLEILPVYQMGQDTLAMDTTGILYDDGGRTGVYGNNLEQQFTIAAPCARWVNLSFSKFELEPCCDFLYVYDGPDTTGTLLLLATGNEVPGDVSSSTGQLTLVFKSNGTGNGTGFALSWRAEAAPASPPLAAFTVNPASLPFGSPVHFEETGSPDIRQWFWDFGDGTRDTGATVQHLFTSPGLVTVRLIADNCTGRDTVFQNYTVQPAPQFSVTPDSVFALLNGCNDTIFQTITVYNPGQGDLIVKGTELPKDPSQLDSIRSRLNRGAGLLTALIPVRYDFSGGMFGAQIGDGGRDMYDQGNILVTNLDSPVFYFDNFILPSPAFGPGGQYFTRKFPGLFVLAADLNGVDKFGIRGGLGADGFGTVEGGAFFLNKKGVGYRVFAKRVFGTPDPSVNHLIILEDGPGLSQLYATDTDKDDHTIRGLDRSRRLYYLLFAGDNGHYMADSVMLNLADGFLDLISPGPDYLQFAPDSLTIAPGDSARIVVQQMSNGMANGTYETDILIQSNAPGVQDTIIPCLLEVRGQAALGSSLSQANFGPVQVRGSNTLNWVISNTGCDTLKIQAAVVDSVAFSVTTPPAFLLPGAADTLALDFRPGQIKNYTGACTLLSSADTLVLPLAGSGIAAPWAEWNPDTLRVTFTQCDDSTNLPFAITNLGSAPLNWQARSYRDTLAILALTYGVDLNEEYPNTLQALDNEGVPYSLSVSATTDADSLARLLNGKDLLLIPEVETGFPAVWAGFRTPVLNFVERGGGVVAMASLSGASAYLFEAGLVQGFSRGPVVQGATVTRAESPLAYRLPSAFSLPANTTLLDISSPDFVPVVSSRFGNLQFSIAGYRRVKRGLIAVLGVDFSQRSPEADRLLANAVIWAGNQGTVPWLQSVPRNAQVLAGDTSRSQLTVRGTGLWKGTYAGDILFETNDPAAPTIRIPTILTVDAPAELSLSDSCLDFGASGLFRPLFDTLYLTNSGCDTLQVDSLSLSGMAFSHTPNRNELLPGERDTLFVRFEPRQLGMIRDTLTIYTSAGQSRVCLQGDGRPVPETRLKPDSIRARLTACTDTMRYSLWIHNTGSVPTPFKVRAGRGRLGRQVLVVQDAFPWGLDMANFIRQATTFNVQAIVSTDLAQTDLSPFGWILVLGDQPNAYYNEVVRNEAKLEQFVRDGGLLQMHLATRGVGLRLPGGITAIDGNREAENDILRAAHPLTQSLPSPLRGNMANHGYFSNVPPGALLLTETRQSQLPTTLIFPLGRGEILATTMTWEYLHQQPLFNSQPLLSRATDYFQRELDTPPSWVSLVPDSGLVAANDSQRVEVLLHPSGLNSGDYRTSLSVQSQDPLRPNLLAHLHMELVGRPVLALADSCLDFGQMREFETGQDTIWIENPGCDTLRVWALPLASAFQTPSDTLEVYAGNRSPFPVAFLPVAPGIVRDTLYLRSNAGDTTLCLQGEGLGTPRLDWLEDTIRLRLKRCDDSLTVSTSLRSIGTAALSYTLPGDPQEDSLAILALTLGTDTLTPRYIRMRSLLQQYAPRHIWKTTASANPRRVEQLLAGVDVCLVPPLDQGGLVDWNALGPVIQQFVDAGGGLVWCGSNYLQGAPLVNSGLFQANYGGRLIPGTNLETADSNHPVTPGLAPAITTRQEAFFLTSAPAMQPLLEFEQGGTRYPVFAYQPSGMGKLFWMGAGLEVPDAVLDVTFVRSVQWAGGYLPRTWWKSAGQGTVPVGGQATVSLKVFAGNLLPGLYDDQVLVQTNQPDSARVPLFLELEVVDEPCAIIAYDSLDVCDGIVGFTATGRQPGDTQEWLFAGTDTASGLSAQYSFSGPGTYTVRLITEKDSIRDTLLQQVAIPKPVSASFTYTGSLQAGEPITFQGDSTTPAFYRWDFGDGNFGAFARVVHQYAGSGTYRVQLSVTDSLGCQAETAQNLVVDYGVGIDPDVSEVSLDVFPNPFSRHLLITWKGYQGEGEIRLFDAQGREVLRTSTRKAQSRLALPGISQGLYTLKVQLGDKQFVRKVMRE